MLRITFKCIITALFLGIISHPLFAQVTTDPAFPNLNRSVTIQFDATQGDGGLAGFTGDVYIHTGVITSESDPNNPSDWQHVKTEWGENTPATQMQRVSTDLYELTINDIRNYYDVPNGEDIFQLAMVFRSADTSLEGKGENGSDIFVDLFGDGVHVKFDLPTETELFTDAGSTVSFRVIGTAVGSTLQSVRLVDGTTEIGSTTSDTLLLDYTISNTGRNTVLAIGAILVFLPPLPVIGVSVYNSLWIILFAYFARFTTLALRPVTASLETIEPALDEAARIAGAKARFVGVGLG